MKYTIDRLEEFDAICEQEDGSLTRIPRKLLPEEAREGDVLLEEASGYRIEEDETKRRRSRIAGKLAALLGKR